MYRDKQMSWGNVNASGMSEAVNQAARATALLQEANKGLSGIGDSIAKVGDSMTKYGTDMETRYEKEKNEVIEGIANDIYNSAIADSTDADGRVNFETFDKVTAMSVANLEQGPYAMNKKDSNAVWKHINSLIDRSATTKDNVSIMDYNLNQSKFNQHVTEYNNKEKQLQFDTMQTAIKDYYKSESELYANTPKENYLEIAQALAAADKEILEGISGIPIIAKINEDRKAKNQKPITLTDISYMLSSSTIDPDLKYQLMHIYASALQNKGVTTAKLLNRYGQQKQEDTDGK